MELLWGLREMICWSKEHVPGTRWEYTVISAHRSHGGFCFVLCSILHVIFCYLFHYILNNVFIKFSLFLFLLELRIWRIHSLYFSDHSTVLILFHFIYLPIYYCWCLFMLFLSPYLNPLILLSQRKPVYYV